MTRLPLVSNLNPLDFSFIFLYFAEILADSFQKIPPDSPNLYFYGDLSAKVAGLEKDQAFRQRRILEERGDFRRLVPKGTDACAKRIN
jgi:hypothetical protein